MGGGMSSRGNMGGGGGMGGRSKRDSESRGGSGDHRGNRDPDRFITVKQKDPSQQFPFRTWQQLKDMFHKCGTCAFAAIRRDSMNNQKYGVIRFETPDDARNAVRMMDNMEYQGQYMEVTIDHRAAAEENF